MTNRVTKNLSLVGLSFLAGIGMTLAIQSGHLPSAEAMAGEAPKVSVPARWTIGGVNAMTLGDLPEIDWITVESGSLVNSESSLYEGENVVVVWEGGPAKLIFDEPSGYDEFVVVLKGKLTLTDENGTSASFEKGDMFMLPKGFLGTWDMSEEYRELIVVDTKAYNGE